MTRVQTKGRELVDFIQVFRRFFPAMLHFHTVPQKIARIVLPNSFSKAFPWVPTRLRCWLQDLKIHQKMNLAYAIALGVATTGTILGVLIGGYYERQAEVQIEDAIEESALPRQLRASLHHVLIHWERFESRLEQPDIADEHYTLFLKYLDRAERAWLDLQKSYASSQVDETPEEIEVFDNLNREYDGLIQRYRGQADTLVKSFYSTDRSPENVAKIRAYLREFNLSPATLKLHQMSHDVEVIIEVTEEEQGEAQENSRKAHRLKIQIVAVNILLSGIIAILLIRYTSRTIAQPIQELTDAVQRATQESNFDLKVVVEGNDEVGGLARSFNYLNYSVQQLLEQQQRTKQQLEDQNLQLKELLEQLHQSQIQLVQNEKMSSLGQLVAGVAHEINNPVSFIHGNLAHLSEYAQNLLDFVQLYQQHYPNPVSSITLQAEEIDFEFLREDLPRLLKSIETGTQRIRQTVLSLRNFARMDETELKTVDLHEGLDNTLLILKHRLKATSERPQIVTNKVYGDLPLIECYAGQLNQVFMNILLNAIDAIEELNTQRMDREIRDRPGWITIETSVVNSEWVKIEIADNGIGMLQRIQQQIFNPFFITKPVGKGTGMGMAICHQIVTQKHGGKLDCCSVLGEGTQFTIQIPIQQSA
ncbi:MAG: ATP-binding protein [Cyanobacteriota bacterium]|nr:ATP-binding protein [Cyanobacteriota bacterium]